MGDDDTAPRSPLDGEDAVTPTQVALQLERDRLTESGASGSAPASPEFIHRRLDKELAAEDSSESVQSQEVEATSPSLKARGKASRGKEMKVKIEGEDGESSLRTSHKKDEDDEARRRQKKVQSSLKFADSPDSSEREKGDRKSRKPHGDGRRRKHRTRGEDSDDEGDEDQKKRTPHRRPKKRIEDTSSSSSSEYS